MSEKVWIPKFSQEEILARFDHIKPVCRFIVADNEVKRGGNWNEGEHYWIKPVDPFNNAYTWDPQPDRRVTETLVPICDITTYHSWAYYGFFKPSISEVLAQIPTEHLCDVGAFEIIEHPECADDLNREPEALNAGYHVAKTRLYHIG